MGRSADFEAHCAGGERWIGWHRRGFAE